MTDTTATAPIVPGAAGTATSSAPTPPGRRPREVGRAERLLRDLAIGVPLPILLLVLWHVGVENAWELPLGLRMQYLPLPAEVATRMWDIAFDSGVDAFSGTLWDHLWASTRRVLQGFGLAAAFAIPLGVLMGRYALLNKIVDPTVNLVRPIPVTAWAPLSLLIIGFGDRSTVFLVFIAAFFPILLNTVSAVRQVTPRLLEAGAMLGTGPVGSLYKIVIPAAAPGIVGGLRIALGLSWVIIVVGETVGISVGLGSMITQARDMSKTDLIVAGMVVIGLAGFLTDRLMMLLFRLGTRGRPLIR